MDLTRRFVLGGLAATGLTVPGRAAEARNVPPDLSHLTVEERASAETMRACMMAALSYERVTVRGEDALAEWERLKAAGRGWPVVIGSDEDLERIADQFSIDDPAVAGVALPGPAVRSPAQILAVAGGIRFPGDLRNWPGAFQPGDLRAPVGEWPAKVDAAGPGVSVALDSVSGRVHDKVHLLLLPIRNGWEAPAFLRWGGWNACPPPEYHVAALREWHARFGADLVGINGDTMNVRTDTRPTSRKQAIAPRFIRLLSRHGGPGCRYPRCSRRRADGIRLVVLLVGLTVGSVLDRQLPVPTRPQLLLG